MANAHFLRGDRRQRFALTHQLKRIGAIAGFGDGMLQLGLNLGLCLLNSAPGGLVKSITNSSPCGGFKWSLLHNAPNEAPTEDLRGTESDANSRYRPIRHRLWERYDRFPSRKVTSDRRICRAG